MRNVVYYNKRMTGYNTLIQLSSIHKHLEKWDGVTITVN